MISYALTLAPDDNDTFLVTCPDLPEVVTYGETEADALLHGADAAAEAIACRLHEFSDIPAPSDPNPKHKAMLPLQMTFSVLLFWSMREQRITRAELARRLRWHRPQVERLFDARQYTRIDRLEAAFSALGVTPEVTTRAA